MSEQGASRYPRTFHGLIVSMVVLVIAVVGFWAVNSGFHQSPDARPTAVDYRKTVHEVQEAGAPLHVIYPSSLPKGWTVTSADYTPPNGLGTEPAWSLGAVTDHDTFVGLRLEAAPLSSLIATYVDQDAEQGRPSTIPTRFGDTWDTFTDSGGDTGLGITVGKTELLVYGSADKADMVTFMDALTDAELPRS